MRERERIRRRAGRHQEDRDLALEDLGEALLDPPGPVVIAVAERIAGVGLPDAPRELRGAMPAVLSLAKFMRFLVSWP